MTNAVAVNNATGSAVSTLPNPRKGQRERMNQVRATIGGMIDLSLFETPLGDRTMVDPALMKKRIADGQYTLECVLAEQNRVAEAGVAKPTIVDLVGSPAQRTQLREWLIVLVSDAVDNKIQEVKLSCLLRPLHPTLPNVEGLLNGGASHLASELGWKVKLPTFRIKGVGLDQGMTGGHVAAIKAKVLTLVEEDAKRIAAPQK